MCHIYRVAEPRAARSACVVPAAPRLPLSIVGRSGRVPDMLVPCIDTAAESDWYKSDSTDLLLHSHRVGTALSCGAFCKGSTRHGPLKIKIWLGYQNINT